MATNSPNTSLNRSMQDNNNNVHSSGQKNRHSSASSFQIVKCNKCQIQISKNNLSKHEEMKERSCAYFIQSFYQLSDRTARLDDSFLKNRMFEYPFLIGDDILYTSSIEKLKADINVNDDDNVILLSTELMEHSQLNDGDLVNVIDLNNNVENYPLTNQKKGLSTKSIVLRINLKTIANTLKSLYVGTHREFTDPIVYLNICSNIKKQLMKKVIDQNQNVTSIIMNDIEYRLKIFAKNDEPEQKPQNTSLENDFHNLSISKRLSQTPEVHSAFLISEETKIIFAPLKFYELDSKFVAYNERFELLHSLLLRSIENDCSRQANILITGPSGTGKTLAMRTLMQKLYGKMNIIVLPSTVFLSKSFEYEKVNQILKHMSNLKPVLLFMDNLEDVLNEKNKLDKRLVSWLKVLFDDLPRNNHIIIVGATNQADLLDISLRQSGRFEIEIDFSIPSPLDRKVILNEILTNYQHELTTVQIERIAETAHGYTGGDLKSLCKNYFLKQNDEQSRIIRFDQFYRLMLQTKPSTMREITLEMPNVCWSDIGGLNKLKQLLEECVVWPIKHPDAFLRLGIDPPKGILMYGPPGCCKTMIGKALAYESGLNFFSIKGPELFNKWVGESERAVREIFRKARAASPSILFFDEIDALATERGQTQSAVGDRVLAQLLTEIDGIEKLGQVIIIAATNRPDIVDKALLRPGRLDSIVYVALPDMETRKEIFKIRLSKMPLNETIGFHNLIETLSIKSDGYSGAEIQAVCQRAALLALANDKNAQTIQVDHFLHSFNMIRPQTSMETIEFYEKFAAKFNVM
ncbi:ATPase family gene 2 protein homolog A-like isoform X2 [Dermatophagoides pteronyssinus]|uniref:Calmodulin-interacting protein 111-like isoform X2 n=1 Tax=Dermatophagoides pteronyssinus TaxID=6956 RepID=A0A6P6XWU7_DERPT|nr:calmodulin-interacting protein 111-like isoform X2 [Dermatophagoides pteronyssinus]